MLTLTRYAAGALAAAGLLISCSSAGAAVLYDNGPLNGTIDAFGIGLGDAVSDSFALASRSVITGINLGLWTFTGDTVSTVDWGITTTPGNFTSFVASGTAAVVNGVATPNSATTSTSVDGFSTGAVSLGAGVYYLVLQNAVASNPSDQVYWDENNGPSSAISNFLGALANFDLPGTTGSESFQVVGSNASGAPEPASWVLMLVGLGGLGAAVRGVRSPRGARRAAD